MQIWVDADGCPNVVKEILFRVAEKRRILVTFVANRYLRVPPSPYIRSLQVPSGFDVTDNRIVQLVRPNDLVITGDIPLAAKVIENRGYALNPRGEFYTEDNIQDRLSMRNFMEELRSSGVNTGGPASLSQGDRQLFANQLDRF
ncbi:MAG: YaiI/YqxD family protein, partial [Pseudomonadota bacterium]